MSIVRPRAPPDISLSQQVRLDARAGGQGGKIEFVKSQRLQVQGVVKKKLDHPRRILQQVSVSFQTTQSPTHPLPIQVTTANRCLLPCTFTVAGIALHEDEYAGHRCKLGSVTRGWDLLAEASHLPREVASLDIMERHKWAFAGRRVPNIVQLLADLGPP